MSVIPLDARRTSSMPVVPGPASIENEQAFLSALLLHNEVLLGAGDPLEIEHFTEDLHRRIFDVARSLIRSGKSASPLTVRPFVGEQDLGGGLTVPAYLARLCADALPPLMAGSSARILVARRSRSAASFLAT